MKPSIVLIRAHRCISYGQTSYVFLSRSFTRAFCALVSVHVCSCRNAYTSTSFWPYPIPKGRCLASQSGHMKYAWCMEVWSQVLPTKNARVEAAHCDYDVNRPYSQPVLRLARSLAQTSKHLCQNMIDGYCQSTLHSPKREGFVEYRSNESVHTWIPLTTSTKLSLWGVVTITAAVIDKFWHNVSWMSPVPLKSIVMTVSVKLDTCSR